MDTTPPSTEHEARIRRQPHPLDRVLELVRVLRGPGGCPWDRDQTLHSMTPYLQEEVYEVVEAIAGDEPASFREELGDLLFLVLFLGETGGDQGWGSIEEAADGVVEKLIRRHPHVFGDADDLESEGALRQWEEIKQAEKAGTKEASSTLGRRPRGLPALTTAFRISEKAAAVGFQWPHVDRALDKLEEEVGELHEELRSGGDRAAIENEIGDVLYSVVNVARYLGVDPERALRGTTEKFTRRFHHMEQRLQERGKTPSTSTLEEMDTLWNAAKTEA